MKYLTALSWFLFLVALASIWVGGFGAGASYKSAQLELKLHNATRYAQESEKQYHRAESGRLHAVAELATLKRQVRGELPRPTMGGTK